jgi:DNA-binding CsgD family transcriptional regulator
MHAVNNPNPTNTPISNPISNPISSPDSNPISSPDSSTNGGSSEALDSVRQNTLVDQLMVELNDAARTHGLQAAASLFSWARAANAFRRGDWVEANADAQQWFGATADLEALSVTRIFSQAMAAYTAAAIGDAASAKALANEALASSAAQQFPEILAWCWAALGSLSYAQGDCAGALEFLSRVATVTETLCEDGCLTEPTRLYWQGEWIDALLDAGRRADAIAAVAKLREYGERTGDLWSLGVVARSFGRMTQSPVAAEELFHQAMTTFEHGKLEFEVARTFCIRGAHFRGEKASASFDIAEGFRRLQRIGAVQWATWSAGLLRPASETLQNGDGDSHQKPPQTSAGLNGLDGLNGLGGLSGSTGLAGLEGMDGLGLAELTGSAELGASKLVLVNRTGEIPLQLTPSELRVASLITTGSSYKEIASALFISAKTVDFHVQAMYRKAKVNNRVEFVGSFLRLTHA